MSFKLGIISFFFSKDLQICLLHLNTIRQSLNLHILQKVTHNPFPKFGRILGPSVKFRRAAISFVMPLCLSARMEQRGCHWTNLHET